MPGRRGWGRVRGLDVVNFGRAMVRVEEIVDHESFKAWLEEVPEDRGYEVAVSLATRCALRVLPIWAKEMRAAWEHEHYLAPLPILRSILISGVAAQMPTPDIKFSATAAIAFAAARGARAAGAAFAAFGAAAAADDAGAARVSFAAAAFALAVAEAAAAAAVFAADMWDVLQQDIQALERGDDLLSLPLWPTATPGEISAAWTKGRDWMQDNPGYGFWIRWYEAVLAGRSVTGTWQSHWQLMQDIALIAPGDWDKGAEHVAGVIDLITQKHALQRDVAQIKRALENEIFNAETLGRHRDNLPDDLPPSRVVQYRAQLREVLQELGAVEVALEPPVPDVEVLEQATGRLRAAWERFKAFCAKPVMIFIFATASGALITKTVDVIVDEGVPALIQSLRSVLPKPSPAPQAPRHARGERVPDKR